MASADDAKKKRLQQCFSHANTQAAQGNFDYATEMFTQCVVGAPDNTLYMSDDDDILYTIDKITGDITTLGPVLGMDVGAPAIGGDMTFTPDGSLYAVNLTYLFFIDIYRDFRIFKNC